MKKVLLALLISFSLILSVLYFLYIFLDNEEGNSNTKRLLLENRTEDKINKLSLEGEYKNQINILPVVKSNNIIERKILNKKEQLQREEEIPYSYGEKNEYSTNLN